MFDDLGYVDRVQRLLAEHGVRTWLFGGWAEELRGLIAPRQHKDIDLLYPARDFGNVDAFLARGLVEEITAKRFPHKRAFELDGIMTELFLVEREPGGQLSTSFWGRQPYTWPTGTLARLDDRDVASVEALRAFRSGPQDLRPRLDGQVVSAEAWLAGNPPARSPGRTADPSSQSSADS